MVRMSQKFTETFSHAEVICPDKKIDTNLDHLKSSLSVINHFYTNKERLIVVSS